jgi:hypothetical protein
MSDEKVEKIETNPEFKEARQHFKAAKEAMHKSWESMLPPGYLESRRAARKEFLLGLRNLLNVAIDHAEKK